MKDLFWLGGSKKDLMSFPKDVVQEIGYVLHCFQKKSNKGIKTPREEINIIKQRLKKLKPTINKEG